RAHDLQAKGLARHEAPVRTHHNRAFIDSGRRVDGNVNRHPDGRGTVGLECERKVLERIGIPPRRTSHQLLGWAVWRVRAYHHIGDPMDLDIRYSAASAALDRFHFHREVGESSARTKGKLHGYVLVACAPELRSAQTVRPASIAWEDLDERVHKPGARRRRGLSTGPGGGHQAGGDYCHNE